MRCCHIDNSHSPGRVGTNPDVIEKLSENIENPNLAFVEKGEVVLNPSHEPVPRAFT
jgi:hypothetical protein